MKDLNFDNDTPIFIINTKGKIIDLNEAFCNKIGINKMIVAMLSINVVMRSRMATITAIIMVGELVIERRNLPTRIGNPFAVNNQVYKPAVAIIKKTFAVEIPVFHKHSIMNANLSSL